MALGSNVRKLREAARLTQTQLAELAGMDQQALAALEKRDSKSSSFAPALAKALNVSLNQLLGIDDDAKSPAANGNHPHARNDGIDEEALERFQRLVSIYWHASETKQKQILRMAETAKNGANGGQSEEGPGRLMSDADLDAGSP